MPINTKYSPQLLMLTKDDYNAIEGVIIQICFKKLKLFNIFIGMQFVP